MSADRLDGLTHRDAGWAGLDVVVAGSESAGSRPPTRCSNGARGSLVVDGRDGDREQERAQILRVLGAEVELGPPA